MWGIGMANENEPGRTTEEPVNTEAFDQVSDEGDGPSRREASHAVSALAGQDRESNRNDEDEESKFWRREKVEGVRERGQHALHLVNKTEEKPRIL